jgi:hypothetical protein
LDWTVGINELFGIDTLHPKRPLEVFPDDSTYAEWYFVHYSLMTELHVTLKKNGVNSGLLPNNEGDKPHLSREQFILFQKIHGKEKVFILHQKSGDTVRVENGWIHAVVNFKPNIKIVWNEVVPDDVHLYLDMLKYLEVNNFNDVMIHDYTRWLDVLVSDAIGRVIVNKPTLVA